MMTTFTDGQVTLSPEERDRQYNAAWRSNGNNAAAADAVVTAQDPLPTIDPTSAIQGAAQQTDASVGITP